MTDPIRDAAEAAYHRLTRTGPYLDAPVPFNPIDEVENIIRTKLSEAVPEKQPKSVFTFEGPFAEGWNECRKALLGGGE